MYINSAERTQWFNLELVSQKENVLKIKFLGTETVILRTHKRTKSDCFSDTLFRTLTVAPSVGLFSSCNRQNP
jgi:hypothetical protein